MRGLGTPLGGPALRVRLRDHATAVTHLVLAVVCYLPLLLTARGRVASDTRQELLLNPGRYLTEVFSMWDPSRDLGTVTHQNIVLAFPMGVFFRACDLLGLPLWTTQRLWLGSILFVAGAGVLHLARTLGWREHGAVVAAFVYAMSPYVLQYGTRTSVLLLPWAALPWLIGLTARALRTGGWRHPALFALVALSIAVNATGIFLLMLGPALWLVYATWGTREVTPRAMVATALRIGALTALTSVWWIVALLIEKNYGLPLLDYTETIEQVATTSAATELLRGLGYWIPYLVDSAYADIAGARFYFDELPVVCVQFAVVGVAFLGLISSRWKHRTYFVLLVVVGVVVGMGAYPTDDAQPLGSLFIEFANSSSLGLALRSTSRAAPLAVLGIACLLGMFSDAIAAQARRTGLAVAAAIVVLSVAVAPSILRADLVDPNYSYPEDVPSYWTEALAKIDADAHTETGDHRMLEVPGLRYAAYRWGTSYEPVTQGLTGTPSAWREQIPGGGAAGAELLIALDNRMQEGRLDPDALAPLARLMGVSRILVRNDLAWERYETSPPEVIWQLFAGSDGTPVGLDTPIELGPRDANVPDPAVALGDERVAGSPDPAGYPALAIVPVQDAPELARVVPVAGTVLLDGDADGLVDAAGAGLVDGIAPVLYAATTAGRADVRATVLDAGATIVLTDSNRRVVRRWRSIRNTTGITLRADEDPADEAHGLGGEAPLAVFDGAGAGIAWQTVTVQDDVVATATRYGDPFKFEAAYRPARAVDGDVDTAWAVGPAISPIGERLTLTFPHAVRTDALRLQATRGNTALRVVDVRIDDGPAQRITLEASARSDGQMITFPEHDVHRVSVEIVATDLVDPTRGPSPVGIAELDVAQQTTVETVRLPTAFVRALGDDATGSPLAVVLTRERGDAAQLGRSTEETTIARRFELPDARAYAVTGAVRRAPTVVTPELGVESRATTAAATDAIAACRDDLVLLDGAALPVRVEGTPPVAGSPAQAAQLRACNPVQLAAGRHELRTTGVGDLDIDQLVLASTAAGTPATIGADGHPEISPVTGAPSSHAEHRSGTKIDVTVRDRVEPSWLVLAESRNDGWEASTDSDSKVSAPLLVNGFANGWLVTGDAPSGTETFSLRWAPQRTMNIALIVSLAGVLLALALVLRGRRFATAPDLPSAQLDAPWADGPRAATVTTVVTALAIGLAVGAAAAPGWGVAVGVLVAIAGRWRHGHALLSAAALASIAAAIAGAVLPRVLDRSDTAYEYVIGIDRAHRFALAALAFLVADLVFGRARRTEERVDPIARIRERWPAWRAQQVDDVVLPPATPTAAAGRTRFLVAAALGATVGLLVFVWILTSGTWDLFAWHPSADFYDSQARQLLHGHLDMPPSVLHIEGFVVDGRTYMYQGPTPAFLRIPFVLFGSALDGRLAGLSMVVAYLVAAISTTWLAWQVRALVRGDERVGAGETLAIAGFMFLCTGGSVLLAGAAWVSVYHEAVMWGVALTLLAFALLLRLLLRPRGWLLGLLGVVTLLALWARASVALGIVAALGFVFLAELAAWFLARRGDPSTTLPAWLAPLRPTWRPSLRIVLATAAVVAVPLVLYAVLNVAKFGTLFSVPWRQQVQSGIVTSRQEFLSINGGTYFGLQFIPTTLVEYLRPDALAISGTFPFVRFNASLVNDLIGIGDARFDKVDATGSLTTSAPFLLVLGVVGVVTAWATRGGRAVARLRVPLLGAAAGAATIFVFGYIAQRYLVDALPLLVVAGTGGFFIVARALGRRTAWRIPAVVALVLVGAFSFAVVFGQSLWYSRVFVSVLDPAATERFVQLQQELSIGDGSLPVGQGDVLPTAGRAQDLFIVGDCDGLYVSDGGPVDELNATNWKPVQRTSRVGTYRARVTFPERPPVGTVEPLLVAGTALAPEVLAVEYLPGGDVRFTYQGPGHDTPHRSELVHVEPGSTHDLLLAFDPQAGIVQLDLDGRTRLRDIYRSNALPTVGRNRVDDSTAPRFSGQLDVEPDDDALCRAVRDRAGLPDPS